MILKLLSQSVARLESGDRKRKQEEKEVTFLDDVKKVRKDVPAAPSNTDMVESLIVYHHLKEVSPKIAEKLSNLHTSRLVSKYLENLSPELANQLSTIQTPRKKFDTEKPVDKKTRKIPKRFTPLEDAAIKAAVVEAGEDAVDSASLAKMLNRHKKTVTDRIKLLKRTGGVLQNIQFTLEEDSMLLESLIIPRAESQKVSEIVLVPHHCSDLAKQLDKTPTAVLRRWTDKLQPWLLQHYSGTLNLRVERMLANYIAQTFSFSSIDWPRVAARSEFAGHTERSLRVMYLRKPEKTMMKFRMQSKDVTPQHVAEYCELVYGVEATGQVKAGLSLKKSQRQKDVIALFERSVAGLKQKEFVRQK